MATASTSSESTSRRTVVDASTPLPRGWARLLSTRNPRAMYITGVVEIVVFAGLGSFLAPQTIVGGILIALIGVLGSSVPFASAHWSRQHPDIAEKTVAIRLAQRNRLARRHPAYFIVFIPLLVTVDVAVRWHRIDHSSSAANWWIPAVVGLAFGILLGGFVLQRARRQGASGSSPN